MRWFIWFFATGFGSGYSPLAPGTAGSLLAAILFWLLPLSLAAQIALSALFLLLGYWTADKVEQEKGKDPALVTIDEVVGQWIVLWNLPKVLWLYVLAFALFRLFDIWKPFPINRLQDVKGGWGIMLDDVLAGFYGLIIIQLIRLGGV